MDLSAIKSDVTPETIVEIFVPVFLLSIAVEIIYSQITKKKTYRLFDTIHDLALGTFQQMVGVLTTGFLIGAYLWFQSYLSLNALFDIPLFPEDNIWSWVIAFVLVDFVYYWFHRSAHEINLFWASHIAHHSSEEYNLAVALRQSATQKFFSFWFYMPLAIIGVTWKQMAVCYGLNLVYQFFVHTRLIGKLGPLEWFMNTPSHHRVHHGRNLEYIDKNHAGVFIIWDKLFRTFQEEHIEPTYGITTRLHTYNPLQANFHHYFYIFTELRKIKSWRDRLLFLFKRPGWKPDSLGPSTFPQPLTAEDLIPLAVKSTNKQATVIIVSFAILLLTGTQIMKLAQSGNMHYAFIGACMLLIALSFMGWMIDRTVKT